MVFLYFAVYRPCGIMPVLKIRPTELYGEKEQEKAQ